MNILIYPSLVLLCHITLVTADVCIPYTGVLQEQDTLSSSGSHPLSHDNQRNCKKLPGRLWGLGGKNTVCYFTMCSWMLISKIHYETMSSSNMVLQFDKEGSHRLLKITLFGKPQVEFLTSWELWMNWRFKKG